MAASSSSARTSLRVAKSIPLSASAVRVDICVCATHQSSTSYVVPSYVNVPVNVPDCTMWL